MATPAAPRSNRRLYSPAPIYPEYEEAKLARSLAFWRRTMGESDPTVARVLAGRTPEAAATRAGARLEAGRRRASARSWSREAGKAVAASDDPMIRLARDVDAEARAVRKVIGGRGRAACRPPSMP